MYFIVDPSSDLPQVEKNQTTQIKPCDSNTRSQVPLLLGKVILILINCIYAGPITQTTRSTFEIHKRIEIDCI